MNTVESLGNPPEGAAPPAGGFRWRFIDLLAFLAFCPIAVFISYLLLRGLQALWPEIDGAVVASSLNYQLLITGVMEVSVLAFIGFWIVVVRRRRLGETFNWFGLGGRSRAYWIRLGLGLAVIAGIASTLGPKDPTPLEELVRNTKNLVPFIVFGIAIAPLIEELIFRGFLFRVFDDIGGRWLAIPASAVPFALLHLMQLGSNWVGFAVILSIGSLLSVIRGLTGSIVPSLTVHVTYNSVLFISFILGRWLEVDR